MNNVEPQGCLTAILRLFGIRPPLLADTSDAMPYRRRDDFLSAAELSFFRVLQAAVGDRAVICPKVNLADLIFVARPEQNQRFRNKIDRKHVDFVLCDPFTVVPRCGIELDDSSHARPDRQERDEFVDRVFEVAGLPLVRIPAQGSYSPANLLAILEPHIRCAVVATIPIAAVTTNEIPNCPKCGVPMVRRMASKGTHSGRPFWGCPNYPKCREIG